MEEKQQNTNPKLINLGQAVATPQGQYAIRKPAIIGYHSYFLCPKCGRPVMFAPAKEGVLPFACKHCNTRVFVKVVTKEKIIAKLKPLQAVQEPKVNVEEPKAKANVQKPKTGESQQGKTPKPPTERFVPSSGQKQNVNAKIVWGGLFSRKSYILRDGDNWIGRMDNEEPSDIMVKDQYMSRRSAHIQVIRQKGEMLFKFIVEHCTNSVKVNGKAIEQGQCIYLNYEDRIEMGTTTFFVKKVKTS